MKRLAIPISDGRLSKYFSKCNYFEIFEIENNRVASKTTLIPDDNEANSLPKWATKHGITDIITYKIRSNIIMQFALSKINTYVGIPVNNSKVLVADFLRGNIKSDTKIIAEIIVETYQLNEKESGI